MGKTTLIVPDLHTHWEAAEEVISDVEPDQILFLGDYFDDWEADSAANRRAGEWLRESLQEPNRIHLWGNHDLHYCYPRYRCGGFHESNYRALYGTLRPEDWRRLRWFAWVDGWLCSHAGLHSRWVPEGVRGSRSQEHLDGWLRREAQAAERVLLEGQEHWFWAAGRARGGILGAGGLLWLDYTWEFYPVTRLNQIVGHTKGRVERWKHSTFEASKNVCLDAPNTYGLVRDSTVTIIRPAAVRPLGPLPQPSLALPGGVADEP